jgi:hypothetical protein
MCALPLHAWTMLLAFRDLTWLTDRTNAWDAVGVLCYGLLFALVESGLLFLATAILGLAVPRAWDPDRRIALLGALVLVLSMWAMISQLFFLTSFRVPDDIVDLLVQSRHPARIIYSTLPVVVAATFALPAWAVLRAGRGLQFIKAVMERLGILATLYLVFDAAGLVIVLIRNI